MFATVGDTTNDFLEEIGVGDAAHLHVILLIQVAGWIGDFRRPLGIIGEEQQTFARFIEASYWANPGQARIEQGVNGGASLLVGSGSDESPRFVQDEID